MVSRVSSWAYPWPSWRCGHLHAPIVGRSRWGTRRGYVLRRQPSPAAGSSLIWVVNGAAEAPSGCTYRGAMSSVDSSTVFAVGGRGRGWCCHSMAAQSIYGPLIPACSRVRLGYGAANGAVRRESAAVCQQPDDSATRDFDVVHGVDAGIPAKGAA